MHKWLLLIGLIILTAVVIFSGLTLYGKLKRPVAKAYQSMPGDVVFFIEILRPGELWNNQVTTSKLWQNLKTFEPFFLLDNDLNFLKGRIVSHPKIKELFENSKTYLSFHPDKQGNLSGLITFELPAARTGKTVVRFAGQLAVNENISETKYKGTSIYRISVSDFRRYIYYSTKDGLFLCSFSKSLVEASLDQMRGGRSLSDDPSFVKASSVAGKKVTSVMYVNTRRLGQFWLSRTDSTVRPGLAPLKNLAQWTALDIYPKKDKVIFTGFTIAPDSSSAFLNLTKQPKTLLPGASAFIPSSAYFILSFGIKDFSRFYNMLGKFLTDNKSLHTIETNIEEYKKIYGFDPLHELIKHVVNDIHFILMDDDEAKGPFCLLHLDDVKAVQAAFEESARITGCHFVEKANDKIIGKIILPSFIPAFLSKTSRYADTLYYTAIGDYMVFGCSARGVKKYAGMNSSHDVMSEDKGYISLSENLISNANIFLYARFRKSTGYFSSVCEQKTGTFIRENQNRFGAMDELAVQFIFDYDDMIMTNVLMTAAKDFIPPPVAVRKLIPEPEIKQTPENKSSEEEPFIKTGKDAISIKLDGAITSGPYLIRDHTDNSEKVCFFDNLNHIYLIDCSEKIIWKKNISGQPLGRLWQVDYFNNGKFQMLFNTSGQIHAIDIKGNELPGFPVNLKKKATNGMAVFDYDNSKKYRILIAFENNLVYNLDMNCRPIADWKKVEIQEGVSKPVQFFRIGGKDIIAITTNKGTLNFVNRRGEKILQSLKNLSVPLNSAVFNGKDQLITTDNNGNIVKISNNGGVKMEKTDGFGHQHYFLYGNLSSANKEVYIFIDGKKLFIYDKGLNTLLEKKLAGKVENAPVVLKTPDGENVLAVYIREEGGIYFFDSEGEWKNMTMVKGNKVPVLLKNDGDKKYRIVTGSGNQVVIQ